MSDPIKFGVYIGPTGKLKVFSKIFDEKTKQEKWEIDEGMIKSHPLFRVRFPVVHSMSVGWPVYEDRALLKNYEHIGDL